MSPLTAKEVDELIRLPLQSPAFRKIADSLIKEAEDRYKHLKKEPSMKPLTKEQANKLKNEIVDRIHIVGGESTLDVMNSLTAERKKTFDIIDSMTEQTPEEELKTFKCLKCGKIGVLQIRVCSNLKAFCAYCPECKIELTNNYSSKHALINEFKKFACYNNSWVAWETIDNG